MFVSITDSTKGQMSCTLAHIHIHTHDSVEKRTTNNKICLIEEIFVPPANVREYKNQPTKEMEKAWHRDALMRLRLNDIFIVISLSISIMEDSFQTMIIDFSCYNNFFYGHKMLSKIPTTLKEK